MRRAIKVPLFEGEEQDEWRARFEREAQAMGKLRPHPNVVRVHGAGNDRGFAWCALELVDGEGLDKVVARGPLEVDRALEVAEQVGRALEHVHAAGIIHRDLKPANVMIRREDASAVLMDFGLARDNAERERLTKTGVALGTPAYMAPEQAEGSRDMDARVDVYGLGAILYELLSGKPPFQASSQMELMKKVLIDEPEPLSKLRAGVPADVETIVLRALTKEPIRRYPTMTALVEDIARARRGEPIVARRAGLGEKLARRARRIGPRRIAILALGAVVLAGVGGGAVSLVLRAQRERDAWKIALGRAGGQLVSCCVDYRAGLLGRPIPPRAALIEKKSAFDAVVAADRDHGQLVDVRRETDRVVAAAEVALALDAKKPEDARAALGALPPADLETRFLSAVIEDAEGVHEKACAELVAVAGEAEAAKNVELAVEARAAASIAALRQKDYARALLLADVQATRTHVHDAAVFVRREAAAALARRALESGKVDEAVPQIERLCGDQSEEGVARAREVLGPFVSAALRDKAGARALRIVDVFWRRFPATADPALVPEIVKACDEAADKDMRRAVGLLALARRSDPRALPGAKDFSERAVNEAQRAFMNGKMDEFVDFLLWTIRAGLFDVDFIPSGMSADRGELRKQIENVLAVDPKDDANQFLLCWWIYDQRTGGKDVEIGYTAGRDVLQHGHLIGRSRACLYRFHALLAQGYGDQKTDAEKLKLFEESGADLELALKEGYSQPQECLMCRSLIAESLGKDDEAIDWARKAIAVADERVERSRLASLGKLEMPENERVKPWDRVNIRLETRYQLLAVLASARRFDEAEKLVADLFEIDAEEKRYSRPYAALLRFAQGRDDEAWRLIEEGWANSVKMRDEALGKDPRWRYVDVLDGLREHLQRLKLLPTARRLGDWIHEHYSK
jgi:hypothetical protein